MGVSKKEDNPTSFRRHVAFPSRQLLQVPGSPVVCPCRNVLGRVAANPKGLTVYLLSHYSSHSSPMSAVGLYLLRRSGWWISSLFRLIGNLFSAHVYLRFCCKISQERTAFLEDSSREIMNLEVRSTITSINVEYGAGQDLGKIQS